MSEMDYVISKAFRDLDEVEKALPKLPRFGKKPASPSSGSQSNEADDWMNLTGKYARSAPAKKKPYEFKYTPPQRATSRSGPRKPRRTTEADYEARGFQRNRFGF